MILDFLFPKKCVGCKKNGGYVCQKCSEELREGRDRYVEGVRIMVLFKYEGSIRKLIHLIKYKFVYGAAAKCGQLCIQKLQKDQQIKSKDVVLICMPLAKSRDNWRGFNQVLEIGRVVVKELNWEIKEEILVRKKFREAQAKLKRDERIENIKGVFEIYDREYLEKNKDKWFVIMDDVLTSGATMREAIRVLKGVGVKRMVGLVVAG